MLVMIVEISPIQSHSSFYSTAVSHVFLSAFSSLTTQLGTNLSKCLEEPLYSASSLPMKGPPFK